MTSPLLVRPGAADAAGATLRVTPASAGWDHVGFALLPLATGGVVQGGEAMRETCIVLVSGTGELVVDGTALGAFGTRRNPFEDVAPGAAYVPAGARFSLRATSACEVALCTAPARPGRAARIIEVDTMSSEVRGQGANTRYVRNILPETQPADAVLVVEVMTPGGHWSSYPPHKHDTAAEAETALEEVYYHRLDPPSGFVVQRVYTDDRTLDETITVQDGEAVLVPRGYHPVGVPAGYTSYYLNVMAGPARRWAFHNDPAHAWFLGKAD
jgi:5-deoxy-glucuronate isomerase